MEKEKPTYPSVERRQKRLKTVLLEQFRKIPIVQVACGKVGISRATYYRWRADDEGFADEADKAQTDGVMLINDMAESQLISEIRDRNMTAMLFWLKSRHPAYTTKIELNGKPLREAFVLTEEQREVIRKSIAEAKGEIGPGARDVLEGIKAVPVITAPLAPQENTQEPNQ